MTTLIIALIAGIIMGFSFENVMKLIPKEIPIKSVLPSHPDREG